MQRQQRQRQRSGYATYVCKRKGWGAIVMSTIIARLLLSPFLALVLVLVLVLSLRLGRLVSHSSSPLLLLFFSTLVYTAASKETADEEATLSVI
jgi:hypothetical protein